MIELYEVDLVNRKEVMCFALQSARVQIRGVLLRSSGGVAYFARTRSHRQASDRRRLL